MSGTNTVIVRMDETNGGVTTTNGTVSTGTTTTIKQTNDGGLRNMFLLMFVLFVGAITIVFFVYLFRLSGGLFMVIICIYLIAYSLFVLFYTHKKRSCFDDEWEFKVLSYISLYTMFFALFILGVALYMIRQQYVMTGRFTNYIPPSGMIGTTTTMGPMPAPAYMPPSQQYPPMGPIGPMGPPNRVF